MYIFRLCPFIFEHVCVFWSHIHANCIHMWAFLFQPFLTYTDVWVRIRYDIVTNNYVFSKIIEITFNGCVQCAYYTLVYCIFLQKFFFVHFDDEWFMTFSKMHSNWCCFGELLILFEIANFSFFPIMFYRSEWIYNWKKLCITRRIQT